ncbi:galactosylgalactosylxylosylprotein 3-beta-glucuronosyltransferase sqv-8 [Tetranychus urticae]|uniref:Galactosylgalactosylxylosylprotein 3-beta-glucuronosyltransferase n=1 Tax=Tetranychus urticae TaxID=32264 RepID=T1KY59_TETUR|nr:galactosylgalactosylxylosylprotein 3-beta-glucuronosyltransferase sqv-8 [Tetranychus urticae]
MRITFTHLKFVILGALFLTLVLTLFQAVCVTKSYSHRCPEKENTNISSSPSPLINLPREKLPTIYLITPTYSRAEQKAELTRLGNTLLHVESIHWILIEDSDFPSNLISNFLARFQALSKNRSNIRVTHLVKRTPIEYRTKLNDPNWLKPRGVLQRNEGLKWLRNNRNNIDSRGIVYFADDDNTYDLRLFDEMRDTKKVSCWPVGLVGGLMVERPLVNDENKVIGWNAVYKPERLYPLDMAGFAVNITLILKNPKAFFTLKVPRGFQESYLLKQLISDISELEPKSDKCTQVLVWHTRTERPNLKQEVKLKRPSNENIEV